MRRRLRRQRVQLGVRPGREQGGARRRWNRVRTRAWSTVVLVAAMVAGASRATADEDGLGPGEKREIGGGYVLDFERDGLRVRRGKRSAPLSVGGWRPRGSVQM